MFKTLKTLVSATLLVSLAACSSQPMLSAGINTPASLTRFSQPLRPVKAQLPTARGERPVTMLSYIAMDDGLSQAGAMMIDAMEQSVSDRGYYLAFADLQGPDNSFLAYLINDHKPQQLGSAFSYLDKKTKEVDSNDPATLSQTINWAFSAYPGRMKVFDILAHGGGYFGIGTDDTKVSKNPREIMTVADFGTAIRQGLKGRQFDVMNFLSCLMGNVEALYELRDLSKVIIASEDSVMATQDTVVDFTRELTRLSAQPLSPQQIGAQMVAFAKVRNAQTGYSTLAALDMRFMGEFKSSMNVLSNTLIRAIPANRAQIIAAYDQVPELKNSPNTGQRDLITFLNNLIRLVPNPAVQQSALAVKQVLKQKLMISAKDKEGIGANGLSIFLPPSKVGPSQMPPDFGMIANTGYLNTRFAKETSWDHFIEALLKR
ncbi:hypothetical protein COW36_14495 [bacterium (Candidatus Blackallbacteria) CG17_big_fil_post_rev_8_21_14_2_50_48_46]|uniref:Uncharacterized protein n=1 Tax=bacterium (Candidatus Blackallbacteria) CG17_big_fil_post_rev_8_21_14_2_50_48_46 TaxID=2014261 RepID=A0A2M7G2H1_9BACT|nr:MAG: hypothetical protein COW64_12055 [bacterium (Candidatus Blackallbacteria) CG18_big_fil_WC_8_21_14_2_50_49_26]PIW15925.1 MAG: hypothetical protein COW36_14495 [bacterium (Candidatus Blackallbacteria) CG17_big_fil_post_rev_8_21_14_2_50_48_46]PIW50337.1 MAG: hypothetical protein COW20_02210 [bacterium (Candidatus Blackallbacteria) CG13_big_fil_rev_8_21_14_2_50_49_14]